MLKLSYRSKDAFALIVTAIIISSTFIGLLFWLFEWKGVVLEKWFRDNACLLLSIPFIFLFFIFAYVDYKILEEAIDGKKTSIKGLRVIH